MKDINTMATGAADFITDQGAFDNAGINQAGDLAASNAFINALSPFYVKIIPVNDQWGEPYKVYTGDNCVGIRAIADADIGNDDFLIESWGRDSQGDGWVYDSSDATSGMYTITTMSDFEYDLVQWSGSWIRAPRTAIQ